MRPSAVVLAAVLLCAASGCVGGRGRAGREATPTGVGLNARDLIDPFAQAEGDAAAASLTMRAPGARAAPASGGVRRDVLCLSGGGAYGAYSAGILCGWTAAGNRPCFDVVTGISTGALIAPYAFLGSRYDDDIRRFYTETTSKDIYVERPIRGLFGEALADNAPLRKSIDRVITRELVAEIAAAHAGGRRLYVGTTELESRRFIVWDVGGIASRGRPDDRELIRDVLIASSAIPGFFPPVRIPVTVNGRRLVEKHGDGGASQSIFFRPPWPPTVPPAGTYVWCVTAGKLFVDPGPLSEGAIAVAGSSVSDIIYAQARGDLQRIYTMCALNGMEYRLTAIPEDFPAPAESTNFDPPELRAMFAAGFRRAKCGTAWRNTPPGQNPGEAPQQRAGTCLTERPPQGTGPNN